MGTYNYRTHFSNSRSSYNYDIGEGLPNYDPYVYPNGTLQNKFCIESYAKLREMECERLKDKVITPEFVRSRQLDIDLLKAIHKYIFDEFYDWAGQFRIITLHKQEEFFIPGLSIEYATPDKLVPEIKKSICRLNAVRWSELSEDDLAKELAMRTAEIWKIHPFRDGNTRAILGFIKVFAMEHGITLDMTVFTNLLSRPMKDGKVIGYSVRDMFVGACLNEKPEPEHLIELFKKAIKEGKKNSAS